MASGHPRVNCCVEGCRRGTTRIEPLPEGGYWLETGTADPEWLCEVHWRRVPGWLKHRRRILLRAWRRHCRACRTSCYWELASGSGPRIRMVRLEKLIRRTWARCVEVATPGGEPGDDRSLPPGLEAELKRLGL